MPYYPGISQKINRFLARYNIEVLSQKCFTLGHLLFKNSPKMDPKNVIYQIPCQDCGACYIGKTTRHLNCRLKEHTSAVNNPKTKIDKSHPLYKHKVETGHTIDFGGTRPIERSTNEQQLQVPKNSL